MADHSYFEFSCPCGKSYRVEQEGSFTCECGRLLVLDWSGAARMPGIQTESASAAGNAFNGKGGTELLDPAELHPG